MFLLLLSFIRSEEEIPLKPEGSYVHFQSFNDADYAQKWVTTPLENVTGKWEVEEAAAPQSYPGEKMLFMKTAMSYYGISTKFDSPLDLKDQTLVVQYEVRLQDKLECGGAYLKLFGKDNFDPAVLCNETRYIIMFGPDKCGSTNKVHFIFRHKNPVSGVYEEKHMTDAPSIKTDKNNHLYTLIVRPDNSFEILIDAESVKQGNLLNDFSPSVNPPKEIDDPTDKKPEDWVDDEMIDDPEATKPDDWDETQPEYIKDPTKLEPPEGWLVDEPKFVTDPNAQKPEDWDDDIHGEWEAPTIPNPKCESAAGCGEYDAPLIKNELFKGKWKAPKIANPAYKGEWKPRQIPNPNYFEDKEPHNFEQIIGAGFELWMVNKDIGFNNIFIGTDEAAVHQWNKVHFTPKHINQEAEQKKLEPEEKADDTEKKTTTKSVNGFKEAFEDFAYQIKDAYMNLYTENAAACIAITALVVLVPIIIILLACCRSSAPAPAPAPKKAAHKKNDDVEEEAEVVTKPPKVEEVKPEEEEEEEKEEEKKEDEVKKRKKTKKADNF